MVINFIKSESTVFKQNTKHHFRKLVECVNFVMIRHYPIILTCVKKGVVLYFFVAIVIGNSCLLYYQLHIGSLLLDMLVHVYVTTVVSTVIFFHTLATLQLFDVITAQNTSI